MPREHCDVCGARKNEYDVYDKDTFEKVGVEITCPHEHHGGHGP